jgi:hypothetical protein
MALLDALEAWNFTSTIRHAASHPKALPTPPEGSMGEEKDVAMSTASEIKGIMDQIRDLQTLDERYMTLSVATNFAYWRLGVAYQAFADVSLYTTLSCLADEAFAAQASQLRSSAASSYGAENNLRSAVGRSRLPIGFGPNDTMGPQETFAAGAQISASCDHFRNECSTRRPGGVGASTGSGQP